MRIRFYMPAACLVAMLVWGSVASAQSYKRSISITPGVAERFALREQETTAFGLMITQQIPSDLIPIPVPVDPNDMLMQDAFDRADFGAGFAVGGGGVNSFVRGSEDPAAVFRLVPNVRLDGTYDTGNPEAGGGLSPSTFALQGTDEARAAGIFALKSSSANLKTDVQVPSISGQLFMKIQAVEFDKLEFSQVFGRVGNVLGGFYYSSFVDSGTLPQSIVFGGAPAGSTNYEVTQLQWAHFSYSGVLVSAAIENPNISDFALPDPQQDVKLQRLPDFVGRIRYQPLDSWGSLQGAVLVRQFAYEDVGFNEHFTHAVSFSGNARFRTFGYDNVRLGVVGGKGAGSRIFGLSAATVAAGPHNDELVALQNTGAFCSYQHFWSDNVWSTAAYGYASADVTDFMPEATKRSQNGWINLIWNNPSRNIALGIEYQVGQQEVGSGAHGLNHHVQLSLQIGKGYKDPNESSSEGNAMLDGTPLEPDRIYPRL